MKNVSAGHCPSLKAVGLARSKYLLGTCLVTGLFAAGTTSADAALFKWSFSNIVGGVDGTVSGLLEVSEGFDVAATSVILTETTNPIFDSLVGLDFLSISVFSNSFNVVGGNIEAAFFGTGFFAGTTNITMELNSDVFGDTDSQNIGLLTVAGNPLPIADGGDGICPVECLQTAPLFGDNVGQTQFAPTFMRVPEPISLALFGVGLAALAQRRISRA